MANQVMLHKKVLNESLNSIYKVLFSLKQMNSWGNPKHNYYLRGSICQKHTIWYTNNRETKIWKLKKANNTEKKPNPGKFDNDIQNTSHEWYFISKYLIENDVLFGF